MTKKTLAPAAAPAALPADPAGQPAIEQPAVDPSAPAEPDPAPVPAAEVQPVPAAAAELVKARVLANCEHGAPNDVVELTAAEAKASADVVDTDPAAVAYAESLK